jgi:hypothetical protein
MKMNDSLEIAPCVGQENETVPCQLKPCSNMSAVGRVIIGIISVYVFMIIFWISNTWTVGAPLSDYSLRYHLVNVINKLK